MPPKGKKKAVKRESPDLECSFDESHPKSKDKKIRTNDHETLDTEVVAGPVVAQDDGLLSPGTLADIDAYLDGSLGLKPNKDLETVKVIQEDLAENQPRKKMIVEDCGPETEEPPKEDPKPKAAKPAQKAEKKKDLVENQPSKKMIVEDCGPETEESPKEDPKPKPVKSAPKAEKKKNEKPGKKTARASAITKATKKPDTMPKPEEDKKPNDLNISLRGDNLMVAEYLLATNRPYSMLNI